MYKANSAFKACNHFCKAAILTSNILLPGQNTSQEILKKTQVS